MAVNIGVSDFRAGKYRWIGWCFYSTRGERSHKNSIQEEIKSRLKGGNACCYSVQNLLSSSLLSKKLKIKIY